MGQRVPRSIGAQTIAICRVTEPERELCRAELSPSKKRASCPVVRIPPVSDSLLARSVGRWSTLRSNGD